MDIHQVIVTEEMAGERLDKAIAGLEPDWSRVRVQEWISNHRVLVNGKIKKESYRVKLGEKVEIDVPEVVDSDILPENIPLEICYEDEDVLVVNKPRGMVVHPAPGHYSGTLVNALLYHCKQELSGIGGVARPGIVHRIDKDTSGLLMVAKNDLTHHSLVDQLKEHTITRMYLAIVHGVIRHERGLIEAPIGRDPKDRKKMAVEHRNGKHAITHFTVMERFAKATYVECKLETGRTHQIRVHMKSIGHPLIGDLVYGPVKNKYGFEGQALHAEVLGFTHPRSGKRIELKTEPPLAFAQLMEKLRSE
ncbi:RluA family pseudouridine synthase [Shimazuella sp. AN120528]|uniref:RluA family pseudouridine synthase n=1 Tax=Shimazuella soli TaxID=1892854 RepID=UPI001F0DCA04|nr:RluA family pseudouridine synthase [Shimazuella soli]MCH5584737.1 RluA family pseudouridine synthase [Shimazuella soli]